MAERTTVSELADEFRKFREDVKREFDELNTSIQTINISGASREYKDALIEKHDKTLYGETGHEKRLSKLEDRVSLILWALTLIVTPLLIAIGAGVVQLLRMGV